MRCVCCESAHGVTLVDGLPWCPACVANDCPDEYATGFSHDFTAAIDAEQARRVHDRPLC